MSDLQNERFRQKVRDRNLGNVEVHTYPANPAAAAQKRVVSKLELHRLHGKEQGSDDTKPAEDKAPDKVEAKTETPADPKPKADTKPAEDKRK